MHNDNETTSNFAVNFAIAGLNKIGTLMSYLDELKRFAVNFTIVSISATVAKTISAPIDRIKLILQNQNSALQVLKGERKKYDGIVDCLRRLPKEQVSICLLRFFF